ncbi:hypothetical protein HDIA_4202 [Hartmannibacter diazotrophicus]|uniref:Cupin type-2 domain-containing protein n=1 Tax=Hartmannibacter diazotrophicus TaxID=1482074 RepID=A0A2C9DBX7_9HYPH|nr:cupin domain-containing protein [Hartmannibacter diazotrophicus]SON57743.1 hypothetical protein HDIA_4202 [Hartmannibacter diazotrophicus]
MTSNILENRTSFGLALAASIFVGAVALAGTPAAAGDCPADQTTTVDVQKHPSMPAGVTDNVIATIDLSSKGGTWKGQMFRMRKLVVQPGGIVPWHEHNLRPANILVLSGSITEYRSTCKVGIRHRAGDVTTEFGDLAHWWKNTGKKPAVLISSDILPPAMADDQVM